MKRLALSIIALLFTTVILAQKKDSIPKVVEYGDYYIFEGDTLTLQLDEVKLPTVFYFKNRKDEAYFYWLRKKTHKAYPYAKLAQDRLTVVNKNLEKIKGRKLRKKYVKRMQDYFEKEYKAQLKKLTRTEGRILTNLIHRQMGITVYDMIKEYNTGFKAYVNQRMAKLFDIDLKDKYEPATDNEDYLVELILEKAFAEGTLESQPTVLDFDFGEIKAKKDKHLDVEYKIKF